MTNESFEKLIEFRKEKDRFPDANEVYKGERIGDIFKMIKYKDIVSLSDTQKESLSKYGFEYDLENLIHKIDLIIDFYTENKKFPRKNQLHKGEKIGVFFYVLRNRWVLVPKEQKRRIEDAGIILVSDKQYQKNHKRVLLLCRYYREYGRTPFAGEKYDGILLYNFVLKLRKHPEIISSNDNYLLRKNNVDLDNNIYSFEIHKKVEVLEKYYRQYGCEPSSTTEYEGVKLGAFLTRIICGSIGISRDDEKLLKRVGYDLTKSKLRQKIEGNMQLLVEFIKLKKRIPKKLEEYKNVPIGAFYKTLSYGKLKLDEEELNFLKNNGIYIPQYKI